MSNSRRGIRFWISAWLPVVIGIALISMESTEYLGSDHTTGPLRWLFQAIIGPVSDARCLWKPPYRLDVSGALQPGANQLEIKVSNEWSNRIAGDRGAAPEKRVLAQAGGRGGGFGGFGGFGGRGGGGLANSGLLGPVTVVAKTTESNGN